VSAIPVIDIAPLVSGSPEQAHAVARVLGRACRDVGFFYVSGHGVPPALTARVFDTSAAFFAGPASIREAASFSGPGGNRGYIRLGGEALDPAKPPDIKEAFNIGLELAPDDPDLLARAPFRAANLWPDMPGFRDTMIEYFNRLWRLGAICIAGLRSTSGSIPISSRPGSTSRTRRCACCIIRRSQSLWPTDNSARACIPTTAT